MGLRTFPLVALGSCAYIVIGISILEPGDEALVRLIQGLIAGIGFLGGGAILKDDAEVRGTATAASVWVTGAMGAGIGFGRYDIALVIVALNLVILRWLKPFKSDEKDTPADS
jgi:putative Mg2+ transporter-C (MgtC) family protein